jgi:hypothetical protein
LALSVNAYFNWTLPQIRLIGFILTLSSTAVALMVLQGLGQSRTHAGQLTVGVLVAQDIAVVPMLVFAQSGIDVLQQWPLLLVRVVIALVILAALLVWIGKTARQRLPMATLLEGNVELTILFSLGICFLAASLTGYIGLSPVFGAFCAGLALLPIQIYAKPFWMQFSRCNRCCLWCFSSRLGCLLIWNMSKAIGGDCWCDLWCSVYQNPSWMGAFNHWRRASGTGACVIACYPTNRRIQLCFDNKRGRIGHFYKF